MRLSEHQADQIRHLAEEIFGGDVRVSLFGSRLDDTATGGDVDILVESASPVPKPAWQASQLSARASRQLHGRKVDVVVMAPNVAVMPIHRFAKKVGTVL